MLQNILMVLLLREAGHVESLTYIFRRTNILGKAESWENNDRPCENDRVCFDKQKITTALIVDSLRSQTVDLPNDGILFFGEAMELGRLGSWQCKKRQDAEEVHYKGSPSLGYHNGSNWMLLNDDEEWRPALHALQVPSSQDVAIIPSDSGTRILLEDFVIVSTLMFGGRAISDETFDDLLLRSIEGQFQFEMAPKLKSLVNIGNIDYQWPKFTNTVTILGESTKKHDAGLYISNLEPGKLALICSYQRCQSVAQYCDQPFRPIGHCCEICGSMLRFRAATFNFGKFQKEVENYKRQNRVVKKYGLDIGVLRLDRDDLVPWYQVVVLARNEATRQFEERIYYQVLKELIGIVGDDLELPYSMSMLDVEETISIDIYSFSFGDLILVTASLLAAFTVLIGIILAIRQHSDLLNPGCRRLSRRLSFYEAVVRWRSAKAGDELELLHDDRSSSSVDMHSVQNSMEQELEYINIAFDKSEETRRN